MTNTTNKTKRNKATCCKCESSYYESHTELLANGDIWCKECLADPTLNPALCLRACLKMASSLSREERLSLFTTALATTLESRA